MTFHGGRRPSVRRAALAAVFAGVFAVLAPGGGAAESYRLEDPRDSVFGEVRRWRIQDGENLAQLSRRLDLGFTEIRLANPRLDPWLPGEGALVVLPTQFVLPHARRSGIVLNIPEMRLYFYRAGDGTPEIRTYAIGIGRQGWATPIGQARITRKRERPTWRPPKSILAEMKELGEPLPSVVPPGPDNPLGEYALNLSMPGYLLHGTNQPHGVGMRVSHGCIRLNPDSIAELYRLTRVGTSVHIVDQPAKLGRRGRVLYLEAHPPLEEDKRDSRQLLAEVRARVVELAGGAGYFLEEQLVVRALRKPSGVPLAVGLVHAAESPARLQSAP